MESTQNNLENPLHVNWLDINGSYNGYKINRQITTYEYQHMQYHDPNCLYYTTDGEHVYLGDFELYYPTDYIGKPKCYMTYDPNNEDYVVCKLLDFKGRNWSVVANRWKDPQKALNDMMTILHTSDDTLVSLRVHEILVNYIKKLYGVGTALLNILAVISLDGHDNHAVQHMTLKLQELGVYELVESSRDLDDYSFTILKNEATTNPGSKVVRHFIGLYGIFQKYNLFRDSKYTKAKEPESLDLSKEIHDILNWHVSDYPMSFTKR